MQKINRRIFEEAFARLMSRSYKTSQKRSYFEFHKERFFFIVKEIDNHFASRADVKILEVGPGDYFLSCLLREIYASKFDITCIEHPDVLNSSVMEKEFAKEFKTHYIDLERESAKIKDRYELILCCEVIEHLIFSSSFFLFNLHGLLKEDGLLLVTTDNVSRLTNIIKLFFGKNIFHFLHPFYCFRHNREYTLAELKDLLSGSGYRIIRGGYFNFTPFLGSIPFFILTKAIFSITCLPFMGKYSRHIFFWCCKEGAAHLYFPEWLYEFPLETRKLIEDKNKL
jgi:2-polyprenyl-3-methyl-5-hydroxy-6-metoxy-1,4-benzoquinol methylase